MADGKLIKEGTINEVEFSCNYRCINKIWIFHIKYSFIDKKQNHASDRGLKIENNEEKNEMEGFLNKSKPK